MELLHSSLGSPIPSHSPALSTKPNPQIPFHISITVASKRRRFGVRNDARRFFFSPETDTRAPAKAVVGWWSLVERVVEEKEESTAAKAKPVTVLRALHGMWNLIEAERWIVFVAFGSMIIAAVSSNPETKLFFNSVKKWSQ